MTTLADPDVNIKVLKEKARVEESRHNLDSLFGESGHLKVSEIPPEIWWAICDDCSFSYRALGGQSATNKAHSHTSVHRTHRVFLYSRVRAGEVVGPDRDRQRGHLGFDNEAIRG